MIEQLKGIAIDLNQVYRVDKVDRRVGVCGWLSVCFINGHFVKWESCTDEEFKELERIYYVFLHRDDKTEEKEIK